jgi:hypothetical protein
MNMRQKLFLTIFLLSMMSSAMGQAKLGFVAWDVAYYLQYWREMGYNYNLGTETGIIIDYIKIDGSAYKAGLRPYDVITAIDNKKVSDYYEFEAMMNQKKVGQTISVTYYRNMQRYTTRAFLKRESEQGYYTGSDGNYYTAEQIKQFYSQTFGYQNDYDNYDSYDNYDYDNLLSNLITNAVKKKDSKKKDSKEEVKPQPKEEAKPQPKEEIKPSDVDKAPKTKKSDKNTFAVIIGNEKYTDEADVPYAENDAKIFKAYCHQTLGLSENHIRLVTNAGYNDMRKAVNWLKQGLEAYDGKGSVIFYYAGHGIPDEAQKTAYLLPTDGIGSDIGSAYSLERLYQALSEMPAQSVKVFLDACFSGTKRDGGMMTSARGVAIKTKQEEPKGEMVVFTAAQGDETAYPYKSEQHGMFTYFLLRKLQQTKGEVTLGDLADYIISEVKQKSFDENNRSQTPTVVPSSSIKASWRTMKLR